MEILDLLGFDVNSSLDQSQKLHRANERSNLLVISRVVLKGFLEESMKLRHRMLESDIQQLCDLLMMVEKVLWHGFKSQRNLLAVRPPDAELWRCLTRISGAYTDMNECIRCINNLDNLETSIARIRAFLRLAVMQKKLGDYFQHISTSQLLAEYYESWAFIRHEECGILAGSLVGLSVIDCNLLLDQDYLQQQPPSIDLSSYIRFPSLPSEEEQVLNAANETSPDDLKAVLDQKSYLEERNRYLEHSIADLKTKVADLEDVLMRAEAQADDTITEIPAADQDIIGELEKERDFYMQLVGESNDTVNTLRQQLIDTKKINEDLYTKVRMVEEKCRLFENELINIKERHIQEKELWLTANEVLKSRSFEREAEMERNSSTLEMLKNELVNKTEEYMQSLAVLSRKQEELNSVNLNLEKLQKQNAQYAEKLKKLPVLEQELAALNVSAEIQNKKLAEYEKTLEELGGHLSESGLRILELKEEFLPFSEAQWQDDAEVDNCKACKVSFSVSRRKHHCRSCGMIFCNSCSDARVKLPSNPKPARVCVSCFNLLRSRQNSAGGNGKFS